MLGTVSALIPPPLHMSSWLTACEYTQAHALDMHLLLGIDCRKNVQADSTQARALGDIVPLSAPCTSLSSTQAQALGTSVPLLLDTVLALVPAAPRCKPPLPLYRECFTPQCPFCSAPSLYLSIKLLWNSDRFCTTRPMSSSEGRNVVRKWYVPSACPKPEPGTTTMPFSCSSSLQYSQSGCLPVGAQQGAGAD